MTLLGLLANSFADSADAQPPQRPDRGFFGGQSLGGPGGPGGGPDAPDIELVKEFDTDKNGVLDSEERAQAKKKLLANTQGRSRRPGGRGGPGGPSGNLPKGRTGPKVALEDAEIYPNAKLYDPTVLRTFFLSFQEKEWEQELATFKPTDVEIPALLTVDGEQYPDVGVSFRGASSFFMVPTGSKRSLNLSIDFVNEKQKLHGFKTLNLLNCNGDPSLMSSYLYSMVAGKKIATPKVNFVKVVINGRSWGVYANAQQFNKDFLLENYGTQKGARWKVSGNPRGDAGLRYIGDDVGQYKDRYDIKSKDNDQAWQDLISLCKLIDQTPTAQLEETLDPVFDIDGALWFLATDVALINSDGYWTRASDYSLYQDKDGKFHVLPHDMNEAFRESHGSGPGAPRGPRRSGFGNPLEWLGGRPPGPPPRDGPPPRPGDNLQAGRGGPPGSSENRRRQQGGRPDRNLGHRGPARGSQGGGFELDPLVNIDNDRFPLRRKLLANETLRTRYLQYVREIAQWLDWNNVRPKVEEVRELIVKDVRADTRKLMTHRAFLDATSNQRPASPGSLQEFCEKRSEFLLGLESIKNLPIKLVALKSDSEARAKQPSEIKTP